MILIIFISFSVFWMVSQNYGSLPRIQTRWQPNANSEHKSATNKLLWKHHRKSCGLNISLQSRSKSKMGGEQWRVDLTLAMGINTRFWQHVFGMVLGSLIQYTTSARIFSCNRLNFVLCTIISQRLSCNPDNHQWKHSMYLVPLRKIIHHLVLKKTYFLVPTITCFGFHF